MSIPFFNEQLSIVQFSRESPVFFSFVVFSSSFRSILLFLSQFPSVFFFSSSYTQTSLRLAAHLHCCPTLRRFLSSSFHLAEISVFFPNEYIVRRKRVESTWCTQGMREWREHRVTILRFSWSFSKTIFILFEQNRCVGTYDNGWLHHKIITGLSMNLSRVEEMIFRVSFLDKTLTTE